jgi:hypothetical protein
LGGGTEEHVVDGTLVLERDRGDFLGKRENDMKIRGRQQLGLPRLQPLRPRQALALRAMPVASNRSASGMVDLAGELM